MNASCRLALRVAGCAALLASALAGLARAEDARRLDLLDVKTDADVQRPKGFYPVLAYSAELKLDSAADRSWLNVAFAPPAPDAKSQFSAVFFEFDYAAAVEPFDGRLAPDGSADWPNVWLGWDALTFDYDNPQANAVTVTVLIQDWVSWYCPKYEGLATADGKLPQLYEEDVTLKSGRGTASIDLKRRPLWMNTKRKGLALDDVRAFGLCMKAPAGKTSLRVNGFRLTGNSPSAGVMKPVLERVKCGKCGKAFSDLYAPFCPFCGAEVKGFRPIPAELPSFEGKTVIFPSAGGGGKTHGGGGGDATSDPIGPGAVAICHYDIYYNQPRGAGNVPRRGGHWEWRYYLSFKLGDEIKDPAKIRKAEVWLFAPLPSNELTEKPWLPGVLVYDINPCYAPEELAKINWMSMPPFERLVYVSGQHPGPATQDARLKATDLPAPRWLPLDLTEVVREAAARPDRTLLIALKAFTPPGASKEPHGMGHHILAGGPSGPRDRKPKLVIETGD